MNPWATLRAVIHQRLAEVLTEVAVQRERSLEGALARRAAEESVIWLEPHLMKARAFGCKYKLLAAAMESCVRMRNGLWCEFGVYRGETINFIAGFAPEKVHGFDSFEGLPEDWRPNHKKGHFKVQRPNVRGNVELHPGWFDQSLLVFQQRHQGPLEFGHVDADLYSSTKTILEVFNHRIVPGTVLVFDEFLNYPGWREGEHRAFEEFCALVGLEYEVIGYVPRSEQIALKITGRAAGERRSKPNSIALRR